jgi:hypothetical protein
MHYSQKDSIALKTSDAAHLCMHFHGPATDTDKNITDSETPKLQTLCVKEKEKVGDEDIPHFESYADNDQNRIQKDRNMYLSRFN